MNDNFIKQVKVFKKIDQAIRMGDESTPTEEIWNYLTYCVDYINGQRLKELIVNYGYPKQNDDQEFVENLTLLVIHQDFDVAFQKDYLQYAELNPQQSAWLEDRIAMNNSQPQKYGTVFGVKIADTDIVNELRSQIGLEHIEIKDGMPKPPTY